MSLWDVISAEWLPLLLGAIAAYLLGSFSPAIIVGKLFAKGDIRNMGSGNAGATNVLRSLGALPAILTTLGDLAKSIGAVLLGQWLVNNLGAHLNSTRGDLIAMYLAGALCIVGHLYPVYYGFRGGKGVMATLGMMLVLDWRVALTALAFFILVVVLTQYVSLGSMLAGVVMTITTFLYRYYADKSSLSVAIGCTFGAAVITVMVIIKHRQNIVRLIHGTENKLSLGKDKKKKEETHG